MEPAEAERIKVCLEAVKWFCLFKTAIDELERETEERLNGIVLILRPLDFYDEVLEKH